MADKPDLVLRAASRLAKPASSPAPAPAASSERTFVAPKPVIDESLVRPQATPSVALQNPVPEGIAPARTAIISQAALAANGIALPNSGFSRQIEEFRSIKRQVLAAVTKTTPADGSGLNRLLMVTSAAPAEGKTYVSINLALAIAFERDFNVLLVDADAHRQSLISRLGLTADKGWLDLLTDESLTPSDVMIGTNIPNLTILPSGKSRPDIPELMSSRKMTALVHSLANDNPNRLVIFDSLPCLVSTEPTVLASMVAQVLFVVAASETSKEEIESSLRLLEGCPNISLILNKGDPLLIDQFSKYGYGYAYPADT